MVMCKIHLHYLPYRITDDEYFSVPAVQTSSTPKSPELCIGRADDKRQENHIVDHFIPPSHKKEYFLF